jgi:phage virion morphogenesis protein
MTDLEIIIQVDDIDRALREIARRIENTAPAMREIKGVMLDAVEQNFEEEGRPKWVDLAPSTKKRRAAQGKWPGRILQVSGRLASSITGESGNGFATVGTNLEYAAIQQFGGTIRQYAQSRFINFRIDSQGRSRFAKRKDANLAQAVTFRERTINIPARPFLRFTDGDLDEMLVVLSDHITQGL